ncbi:hypothetical protein SMACR_00853 [Sordaria macrospora]|uniref:Uncharacterized protein n=1 Tax=Sordaria macrospora TaxID=5147 RepID=A0A8S9A0Y2_SORMA|nr:hypothetical protein SMACR_00853 [Sordaria macrospora]WPJ62092.1 hypothetical protein SMAC4_00853 [Sordaria macrospora]
MLFPEDDEVHLKRWIVKRLENTSDADADVLADYVLALLRTNGEVEEVRRLCETEIPDFLKEDSSVFVRDVFQAITYKSYLPDAPPVPKHAPPPPAFAALPVAFPAIQPPGLSYDDAPGHLPQFPSYVGQSRKRSFDGGDELDGRDGQYGGRSWKQPRRGAGFGFGGRGGRPEAGNGHLNSSYPPFPENGQLPQGFLTGMSETLAALQQQMGLPPAPGYPASAQGQRRRARCRDYETKGYCSRGNTCLFEHGDDSIYVPPPSTGFGAPFAAPANPIEEYDPTNPGIFTLPPNLPPHQSLQHDGGYSSRGRGGRQQGPKRRPKAPFSADGPVFDRAKSTIVVENIPEENFDEEQVRGFFSQFGNILEVSMQPYKRLAIVKFDTWTSANAAYRSPKVVFDNRFVKIFWYKEEDTSLPPSKPLGEGSEQHGEGGGDGQSAAMPEIDMEEFLRKQEEAQKIYEEKRKKAEELERQREELAKREQELLARHREERAKLAEKMKAKLGGGSQQGDGSEDGSKSKSTSEALRAQLAALEAEALQLGIDPDAMEDTSYSTSSWNARGGYYGGRGAFRGAYRARGFAARGYRGAPFRGGARGNHHAAYAMYSLDNRPKKVTLTGMDFTVPEKDETLRQYLFGIGEFTDIQTTPSATDITFTDRKTAEKFFNGILLNGKEIPGIDGQVELAWNPSSGPGSTSLASTPGSTSTGAGAAAQKTRSALSAATMSFVPGGGPQAGVSGGAGDTAMASAGSVSGSDKDVNIVLERSSGNHNGNGLHHNNNQHYESHKQGDMDYDVADENQWEMT